MSGTGKLVKQKAGTGYAVEANGLGILVLHAWWGLNDFFKSVCASLAREGFSTLALDLYHGQTASDIEAAKLLRQSLDRQAAHQEIKSAVAALRESSGAQIGVIGFSMGAGLALWAMDNCYKDVGATVLFYGTSGGRFRRATSPVLGHFAEHDPYEGPQKIPALQGHLQAQKIPTSFYTYPGTKHWFAESDRPEYDAAAASLAWERTIEFLHSSLRTIEKQSPA
jgi:carboxymethylenebutenolidase